MGYYFPYFVFMRAWVQPRILHFVRYVRLLQYFFLSIFLLLNFKLPHGEVRNDFFRTEVDPKMRTGMHSNELWQCKKIQEREQDWNL